MTTPQLTSRLRGGGCGVLVGGLAIAAHGIAGGGVPRSAEIALLLVVALGAGVFAGRDTTARRTEHAAGVARRRRTTARRTEHAAGVARRRRTTARRAEHAAGGESRRRLMARRAGDHSAVWARPAGGGGSAAVARIGSTLVGGQWAGHYALTGTLDHHSGLAGVLHLPSGSMTAAHLLAAILCAALLLVAERLYLVASSVVRALLSTPSLDIARQVAAWSTGVTARDARPKGARCPRAPPLFA